MYLSALKVLAEVKKKFKVDTAALRQQTPAKV